MATCDECGASVRDDLACRGQFDELLALEFSDPRAGRVHFLTVACYQLQHPATFPLTPSGTEHLVGALRDVVVLGLPVTEVRDRMSGAFAGDARAVARGSAEPEQPSRQWSMTVADVGPPDPSTHADRITEWASAVLADLGVE